MSAGEPSVPRAQVVLGEPVGLLDYRIPDDLCAAVRCGVAVRVTLGRRRTSGYVARVEHGPAPEGLQLKDVDGLDLDRPRLPESLIELCLFASEYYGVLPGEILAAALPASTRSAAVRYAITESGRGVAGGEGFTLAPCTVKPVDQTVLQIAARFTGGVTAAAVERELRLTRRAAAARLQRLTEKGWLSRADRRQGAGPRQVLVYRLRVDAPASARDGCSGALSALLADIPAGRAVDPAFLASRHKNVPEKLRRLCAAGLLERDLQSKRVAAQVSAECDVFVPEAPPEPTPEQRDVVAAVCEAVTEGSYRTFLLQGVTGSGKTEVYLRIIDHALQGGRTALVLVPEIALTPQLAARFKARFGERVATFHSGLTTAQRRDEWERVARGRASIGLGARSALFLPLERLGVVIVDEEHESSFKQDVSPRYHARDLAVFRGHRDGAVVVLGSATPSLESRANADAQRYRLVRLDHRVGGRPLPEVQLCDLSQESRVGDGILTERLAGALEDALRQGDQAILFLNRRGFAPYVYCRDCGHACRCPDCEVSLTLHRGRDIVLCHYCGFEQLPPDRCPGCDGHRMVASGLGTERLEAEINNLFGAVSTVRLDRDAVSRRGDMERLLSRFRRGDARLLIGTQMVTKGHDFPAVTLVGVVSADASLNFPDFRASERTFQLLTQVAGRAGRGEKPGRVFVQAFETGHHAVVCALRHDYESFVSQEMVARRELGYPPYAHLALLRFESDSLECASACAEEAASSLRQLAGAGDAGVAVLGPAPAPLARLKGSFRVQILMKASSRAALRRVLGGVPSRPRSAVRQILDVDPISML